MLEFVSRELIWEKKTFLPFEIGSDFLSDGLRADHVLQYALRFSEGRKLSFFQY